MSAFEKIDAVEFEHLNRGPQGSPTLDRSYALLLERWNQGCRDRETVLRLLFLAWFSWVEPNFLTGLDEAPPQLFQELFAALDAETTEDEEVCFVLRVMGEVAYVHGAFDCVPPGHERLVGRALLVPPEAFEGRGAFGQYFAIRPGAI